MKFRIKRKWNNRHSKLQKLKEKHGLDININIEILD